MNWKHVNENRENDGYRQHGNWSQTLNPEQTAAVRAIIAQHEPSHDRKIEGWSVICTPSTGQCRKLTLVHRHLAGSARRWEIAMNGEVISEH